LNFTREPIIETIISPKEGNSLLLRSTSSAAREEFAVEAVEVVSFGSALFYRSLDRPRGFLLPVADYEIVEVKEARIALKHAPLEKSIKIAGGKEAHPPKPSRESSESETPAQEGGESSKKRDRKRGRRRRGERGSGSAAPSDEARTEKPSREERQPVESEELLVTPSSFSSLIPPPAALISETIARYRKTETPEALPHDDNEPTPGNE